MSLAGVGATVVKVLVYFFNTLFLLAGVILLIGSVVAFFLGKPLHTFIITHATEADVEDFKSWDACLITGMVLGIILIIIGILSLCGALHEKQILLVVSMVLVGVVIVIQLIVGNLMFVYRDDMRGELSTYLRKAQLKALADPKSSECTMYKNLAREGQCCGYSGITPTTCPTADDCGTKAINEACTEFLWSSMQNAAKVGGICMLIIIIFEVVAFAFTAFYWASIRGKHEYQPVPVKTIITTQPVPAKTITTTQPVPAETTTTTTHESIQLTSRS